MRICGAKTRGGTPCKRPAGWGTGSKFGRCAWHGGKSPSGRQYAAKLEAKAEAARLGAEVDLDPSGALELAVRLVAGEVTYLRAKLREAEDVEDDAAMRALAGVFASAIERLARVGKAASDADVAEARLRLDALVVDRLGAAVTAAIDDAHLDPDSRARLDAALWQRLGELSDDDLRPRPKALSA